MATLTEQAFWDLVTTPDLGLDPQSVSDNLKTKFNDLSDQHLIKYEYENKKSREEQKKRGNRSKKIE